MQPLYGRFNNNSLTFCNSPATIFIFFTENRKKGSSGSNYSAGAAPCHILLYRSLSGEALFKIRKQDKIDCPQSYKYFQKNTLLTVLTGAGSQVS